MLENRLIILTVAYLLCAGSLVASERLVSKRSSQTQSQSSASTNSQDPNDEAIKKSVNDDSHLRLYYKVNSPGRSVSQELEHRIVKNPNYQQYNHHRYVQETNNNNLNGFNYYQPDQQFQQQQSQRYNPYTYDPRTSYLIQQLRQQQQQPVINHNINSNPNFLSELERNRLLNLNRLDNLGDANHLLSRPIYQQVQQMQQVQQQNLARNNLLKQLLLLNNDHQQHLNPMNNGFRQQFSPLANFNQQLLPSPAAYEQSKSENGLQYKIVHLKFKIEPQQGRLTGHGLVESDTGSGPMVNSRRFSLMPGELPELMKRLMSSAGDVSQSSQMNGQFPPSQSPPFLQHPLSQFYLNRDPTTAHLFSPTHTSLIKKRQDDYYNNPQLNDSENSDVEKRSMSSSDDDSSLMSYESSGEDDSETSRKQSDETDVDDDKMSDAELNESLKSLQKRTVDEPSGDGVDEDSHQKEISTRSDDSSDESENNESSQ